MNGDTPIQRVATQDECLAVGLDRRGRATATDWGAVVWRGTPDETIFHPLVAQDDDRLDRAQSIAGAHGLKVGKYRIPTHPVFWFFVSAVVSTIIWRTTATYVNLPLYALFPFVVTGLVTWGVPKALLSTIPVDGVRELPANDIVVWKAQEHIAAGGSVEGAVRALRAYAFTDIDQASAVDMIRQT